MRCSHWTRLLGWPFPPQSTVYQTSLKLQLMASVPAHQRLTVQPNDFPLIIDFSDSGSDGHLASFTGGEQKQEEINRCTTGAINLC